MSSRVASLENVELSELANSVKLGMNVDDTDVLGCKIDELRLGYELESRLKVLEGLYNPSDEVTVVSDFGEMMPMLGHVFIREVNQKFRSAYGQKIKGDIIGERIVSLSQGAEHLTEEEQEKFDRQMVYYDRVLSNNAVVNSTFTIENMVYNDASGLVSYASDTTNQISTSYFTPENFVSAYQSPFIGVGFNGDALPPENIAIMSNSYVTTNKGLYNLSGVSDFDGLSSTVGELEKSKRNEVVLFRHGMESDTEASYIFVTITEDKVHSNEALERAKKIHDDTGIKLVIFDIPKIKLSMNSPIVSTEGVKHSSR